MFMQLLTGFHFQYHFGMLDSHRNHTNGCEILLIHKNNFLIVDVKFRYVTN